MRIRHVRTIVQMLPLLAITAIPMQAQACSEHTAGHQQPKPLDKSSIPASAFRYAPKDVPESDNAPLLPPIVVEPEALAQRPSPDR